MQFTDAQEGPLLVALLGAFAAIWFLIQKIFGWLPPVTPGDARVVVRRGRVTCVDRAAMELTGFSRRDFRRMRFPADLFDTASHETAADSERRQSDAPYRASILRLAGTPVAAEVFPRRLMFGRRMLTLRDRTAETRAETARVESERRHRDLFDTMVEPLIVLRSGVILDLNAMFTTVTGHDRREAIGRDAVDLLIAPDFRDAARRRLTDGDPEPWECRATARDKSELKLEISAREIIRGGERLRLAVLRDVTLRRRMEAGLARQITLYRATLAATQDGVLIANLAGRVESRNRQFLEMLRIPAELAATSEHAILVRQALKLMRDPDEVVRRVKELYAHPEEEGEDLLELNDGRVLERRTRSYIRDGKPAGRVWTFRDVTERESSRIELRRQHAMLDALMRSENEGILVIDEAGRAKRFNSALVEMWSLPADFPAGVNGDDALAFVERSGEVVASDEAVVTLRLPDGSVLERTVRTLDLAGSPAGRVAGYRDVTRSAKTETRLRHSADELERRVHERTSELERTNASLRASNTELEAFSFSVSHDLRAPLRAIDGLTRALAEDFEDKLGDEGVDYLRRIRASAGRMTRIMDDLIHLSRANRMELKFEEFDLSAIARSVDATLRRENPNQAAVFDCVCEAPVFADRRLLRVVMENLMGNAWKYSSRKPSAVILFGFTEKPDGAREYFVRDNGAGFDPAYRDKLFKTFSRLHTPQEFEGTGLGLAIVARIIARHGGVITADSAPGEGAVFSFTLPRAKAGAF